MGLAACGYEAATEVAAPATTATAAATTPAAEPTATAIASKTDKELCEEANKAADSFKKAILVLAQSGASEIAPADAKAMLEDFAAQLTTASEGADSEVATAIKAQAAASEKAAQAKDPASALDSAETTNASKQINAGCKKAGVTTNF
ncbi:hypothetical protein B0I29_117112 [Actinoplanes lutulentus]|uniref:Small secreted protein n=2 Tax=Actinoplanes lutulentus TaxID=1287878 RepID=A0A327Z6A4_9ACTN|nr:hypothetical protein B0I29_117112 [Actinoplanes lutulentus]